MKLLICLWRFSVPFLEFICCERRFGILGENFTFKEELYQKPFEIIWKKDKNKVAEWEGQDQVTYFWDRGSLNKENGWLTIHHLEKSDAGEYVLEYVDFERRSYYKTHELTVLDPPSEPEISCNITDVINLRCTMDFRLPVNYTWKIGSETQPSHDPEISIPKNYGPSTTVTCSIKPSQTEKSSQISLAQCSQAEEGASSPGLIVALVAGIIVFLIVIGVLIIQYKRGKRCFLSSVERPNQTDSNRDNELDQENGPVIDQHRTKNGVDQNGFIQENRPQRSRSTADCGVSNGDTLEETSILLDKCGDDCGVNGGMTQGGEGVNGQHLRNSDPH